MKQKVDEKLTCDYKKSRKFIKYKKKSTLPSDIRL